MIWSSILSKRARKRATIPISQLGLGPAIDLAVAETKQFEANLRQRNGTKKDVA